MARKYRMGTLEPEEGKLYSCSRGDQWPPMTAVVYGPTADEARPHVSNAEYHKIRIWESACGLMRMEEGKCLKCPFVQLNGELVKAPGMGGPKPQTTKATATATARRKKRK